MANSLLTISMITKESLRVLTGNLKFDSKGDVEDFKFVVYEWHFGKPKTEAKPQ